MEIALFKKFLDEEVQFQKEDEDIYLEEDTVK